MAAEAPIAAQPLEGDITTFTPIQEQSPSRRPGPGLREQLPHLHRASGILCSKRCDVGRVVAEFAFFHQILQLIVYPRSRRYPASTSTIGSWTATRPTRR